MLQYFVLLLIIFQWSNALMTFEKPPNIKKSKLRHYLYDNTPYVNEYNMSTLKAAVAQKTPLIALLYVPWCTHCMHYAPIYTAMAKKLSFYNITFGGGNCIYQPEICSTVGGCHNRKLKYQEGFKGASEVILKSALYFTDDQCGFPTLYAWNIKYDPYSYDPMGHQISGDELMMAKYVLKMHTNFENMLSAVHSNLSANKTKAGAANNSANVQAESMLTAVAANLVNTDGDMSVQQQHQARLKELLQHIRYTTDALARKHSAAQRLRDALTSVDYLIFGFVSSNSIKIQSEAEYAELLRSLSTFLQVVVKLLPTTHKTTYETFLNWIVPALSTFDAIVAAKNATGGNPFSRGRGLSHHGDDMQPFMLMDKKQYSAMENKGRTLVELLFSKEEIDTAMQKRKLLPPEEQFGMGSGDADGGNSSTDSNALLSNIGVVQAGNQLHLVPDLWNMKISKLLKVESIDHISWKGCGVITDPPGTRTTSVIRQGFTCGMWMLFHYMTVAAEMSKLLPEMTKAMALATSSAMLRGTSVNASQIHQQQRQLQFQLNRQMHEEQLQSVSALEVMWAIHLFVRDLFSCMECRTHFMRAFNSCTFGRCTIKEHDDYEKLQVWLWQFHNKVSFRLLDELAVPVFGNNTAHAGPTPRLLLGNETVNNSTVLTNTTVVRNEVAGDMNEELQAILRSNGILTKNGTISLNAKILGNVTHEFDYRNYTKPKIDVQGVYGDYYESIMFPTRVQCKNCYRKNARNNDIGDHVIWRDNLKINEVRKMLKNLYWDPNWRLTGTSSIKDTNNVNSGNDLFSKVYALFAGSSDSSSGTSTSRSQLSASTTDELQGHHNPLLIGAGHGNKAYRQYQHELLYPEQHSDGNGDSNSNGVSMNRAGTLDKALLYENNPYDDLRGIYAFIVVCILCYAVCFVMYVFRHRMASNCNIHHGGQHGHAHLLQHGGGNNGLYRRRHL